jgi:hypothetical protein
MTYQETIEYLSSLQMFGMKLGLENTEWLAGQFGNPHHRLRFIHVAGTNGKGSVCAMLESIYRAAGWRTGLFTSPHLVSFTERIQVNRQPIAEADVVRWVEAVRGKLDASGRSLTFFEVITIIGLLCFEEQECDLIIWETGLGGRLDATNIVTPLASVITNIELDHEKWLGTTHEQIAGEKAGIIKPGRAGYYGSAARTRPGSDCRNGPETRLFTYYCAEPRGVAGANGAAGDSGAHWAVSMGQCNCCPSRGRGSIRPMACATRGHSHRAANGLVAGTNAAAPKGSRAKGPSGRRAQSGQRDSLCVMPLKKRFLRSAPP